MAIFSSTQPSLRARILAKFPAQVVAGNGLTITKSGLTYTFELDAFDDIALSALADQPTNTLVGRDAVGDGPPTSITVSGGLGFTGAESLELTANQRIRQVGTQLYNAGGVLANGVRADIMVPFAGTITRVTLLADQSGNATIDLWKDTFANFPPTIADTITAASIPALAAAASYQDSTLTGWTVDVAAGDVIRVDLSGIATITRLEVLLDLETL